MEKFRFWCNKVLPLVYDDSLSYYEVLCKLVTKVNEIVDNINSLLSIQIGDIVKDWLNLNFNKIMIDAIYNEEDESITFSKIITGNDTHVYNSGDNTMYIEDKE